MKSKNICKFVPADIACQLMPTQFILETDSEAMRNVTPKPVYRMVLITNHSGKLSLNNGSYRCYSNNGVHSMETWLNIMIQASIRNGWCFYYAHF